MVKIDIISGFLGAGKTTFANLWLGHYIEKGCRPVYIVNEFGQTGLDARLIEKEGFQAIEMANGCVCCTLKEDVTLTIRQAIEVFAPTHIVFEPSGIFIFESFLEVIKSQSLKHICQINCVFTIVDSVNFSASKAVYGSFIHNQIRNAPVIILSKLEKAARGAGDIIADIHSINGHADIMADRWDEWDREQLDALMGRKYNQKGTGTAFQRHHRLKTLTLEAVRPLSAEDWEGFLEQYQSGLFGEIFRIKGVLEVGGRSMLVNIALEDVNLTGCERSGLFNEPLTFIGNRIESGLLKDFFL